MSEMITRKCIRCGRELQIPEDLTEFSCLYCGERMTAADFAPKPPVTADENDLAFVRAHLFDCVTAYPEIFKQFTRSGFPGSYAEYLEGTREIFEAMDRYVCAQPNRRTELLEDFVAQFLEDWENHHKNDKRWRFKTSRERMLFEDKLILAWYTVPAVRDMQLSVSEEFTELLQRRFVEAYPDNRFERTTIAQIRDGFKRRHLCFITTAVCEFEGKPDDCAELTAFRAFRDGWLARTEAGRTLTRDYYRTAPQLVMAIDLCDDREAVYSKLRRDYLDPCYAALTRGEPLRCRDTYVEMVRFLQKRYGLS